MTGDGLPVHGPQYIEVHGLSNIGQRWAVDLGHGQRLTPVSLSTLPVSMPRFLTSTLSIVISHFGHLRSQLL